MNDEFQELMGLGCGQGVDCVMVKPFNLETFCKVVHGKYQ